MGCPQRTKVEEKLERALESVGWGRVHVVKVEDVLDVQSEQLQHDGAQIASENLWNRAFLAAEPRVSLPDEGGSQTANRLP